jgi:hypothetical protein
VLRVEQEVVGQVLVVLPVDGHSCQSIEAHVVVADGQNQGHHPLEFGVEFVHDVVEVVPTVEAGPHAVVVGIVSPQDNRVRVERLEIACQQTGCIIDADVSSDCKSELLGVLVGQSGVVGGVENSVVCCVLGDDVVEGVGLELVKVEGEDVASGDVLDVGEPERFLVGEVEHLLGVALLVGGRL